MKKKLGLSVALVAATVLVGVTTLEPNGAYSAEAANSDRLIMPTGVKISRKEVTLPVAGRTAILSATVTPQNAFSKTVNWESSDENVAKVDGNGKVTAIGGGTAIITVTTLSSDISIHDTCVVTVGGPVNVPVTDITLEGPTNMELGLKETYQINAQVAPSNATKQKINYFSSNKAVATVNANGVITGVKDGKTTIYLIPEDETNRESVKEIEVTVSRYKLIMPTGVTVSKKEVSLPAAGRTVTLSATVTPATAFSKTVNWKSSDENVAKVDRTGKVTAVGGGTATITVTTLSSDTSIQDTSVITVGGPINVPVTDLTLEGPTDLELAIKETHTIKAQVEPSNATKQKVTYFSSDKSVATVNANGLITGLKDGKATIYVAPEEQSSPQINKQIEVTVLRNKLIMPTGVEVSRKEVSLPAAGRSIVLSATVTPTTAFSKTVNWKSSDENVAKVDGYGKVTAIGGGTATITVTTLSSDTSIYDTSIVTVGGPINVPVTDVILEGPTDMELALKETYQIKGQVVPNNATKQKLNYFSLNKKVATVNANGLITGVKAGKATIYVIPEDETNREAVKEIEVTVSKTKLIMPTGVKVSRKTASLAAAGKTLSLSATVTPTTAFSKTVNWKSSDETVVKVDRSGKVTAVGGGSATVTVTTLSPDTTILDTCEITVAGPVYVPKTERTL